MRRTLPPYRCLMLCCLVSCLPSTTVCGEEPDSEADQEVLSAAELALIKTAEANRIGAVDNVYGSVVAIYGNNRQGGGSGVIYDESGLALTNHHVVAGAGTEGWGGLADGKLYRWKLVGTDPGGDVAIIQLTGKKSFPTSAMGDSDTVRVGDWAMAMGNPFLLAEDQRPTVTLGVVSGIKRYQPGAGLNTLVYGNCIQIDSSINPGNSGGPLFNMSGQIIGINGRGSFKERGRVNVGLGYAISSNQIKNFLPDLLATKIAQHGTLDALFGDRDGKVVCETINLDAPVADLGLELGDELVEFEGVKIKTANQFTNIVSTLPADWPAHLVYRHEGEQKELRVRLYALPYKTQAPAQPKPMPKDKDGDGKKDGPKPRIEIKRGPQIAMVNPGTVRDAKLNETNGQYIISQWKRDAGIGSDGQTLPKALRITDEVFHGDLNIGSQAIVLATDGRFRADVTEGDKKRSYRFDGKDYWIEQPGGEAAKLAISKALLNPYLSQAATMAALFHEKPFSQFGKVSLDGGDKSQRRAAYRIKTLDAEGDWFYVWLSVVDRQSSLSIRLLKSSPNIDGEGAGGAVTYSDWRTIAGLRVPHRRDFVRGLAEKTELRFVTTHCEPLEKLSDADFQKSNDDAKQD